MVRQSSGCLQFCDCTVVLNLAPTQAAADVAAIIAKVNGWKSHFKRLGVIARDLVELEALIDSKSLLNQRNGFDPAKYMGQKTARKRKTGAKAFRQ